MVVNDRQQASRRAGHGRYWEVCPGRTRLESEPGAGGRGRLTGGPHLAVRAGERGGGRRTGPEESFLGRKNGIRPVGKEKKEKGIGPERESWAAGKKKNKRRGSGLG